ncbi:MAG: beta-lactamase family protein, partial [Clostridia bacterium]|nr:beta-lactamase family protein [Clostridia bacterium]
MNFQKLSDYLDTLPHADIKQLVCCAAKDHKVIFSKGVGYSDLELQKPATEKDMFLLYSATKVLTCTAAVRLLSEGKLSLEDPVSKYLPEYEDLTVKCEDGAYPATKEMLVRHLFTMTSGYGGRTTDTIQKAINEELKKDPEAGTVQLMRAMAKAPLEFEPGEHYKYGNSHDVLAAVVEVASGMRFSDYLKKTIFDPLGLDDFTFLPDREKLERLSAMYRYNTPLNRSVPHVCPEYFGPTKNYEAGGAGLYASPIQYLKFADAMACGGISAEGYRILPEEYVHMMEENLLEEAPLADFRKSPRKYGYGWGLCGRVHMDPMISLSKSPAGEFGWDGAAGAFVLMDTKNKLSLV